MSGTDADALIRLLLALPHGVEAMSPDIPGLVQTSTNLGVIDTRQEEVEVNLLTRSSINASKSALSERIAATCALAGSSPRSPAAIPAGNPNPRPPWSASSTRPTRRSSASPWRSWPSTPAWSAASSARSTPSMEMVSFGPSMWDVHTPDEHVSVPSVGNFWKLLVAVLEAV